MINYRYNSSRYTLLWDDHWMSYRIDTETAIQIALREVPGQVIKVELDYEYGLLIYEIDILTSYGVYEVQVDSNTGRIIKIERED